jgi:hypothetical protein
MQRLTSLFDSGLSGVINNFIRVGGVSPPTCAMLGYGYVKRRI